jgi:uncharacterized protein YuzB (UPF0349 family)
MTKRKYCMKDDKMYTEIQFALLPHCGSCATGQQQLADNKVKDELRRGEKKRRSRR